MSLSHPSRGQIYFTVVHLPMDRASYVQDVIRSSLLLIVTIILYSSNIACTALSIIKQPDLPSQLTCAYSRKGI